ncbi:peptide/nickel transport system substrate-binding protein [Leucobacter exalbidus]|uniref:Peptide/nickel transport system substrate-binding protein n=1 Tax=Leucobacter exalbidus TaxID=662960 RepID=A0A940PUD4_9MICO|nr:ABC transporter substrate-binding protein [Leucobacter exalbidus]MBP1327117.1 peptide/nickel transport system substrate-binding protein [Leucobacter exalbidus]
MFALNRFSLRTSRPQSQAQNQRPQQQPQQSRRRSLLLRAPLASIAIPAAVVLSLTGCFAQPAATGDDDERISIAMLQPPRSAMNPLSDDAFKLARWATAETLIVIDDAGEALPALATKWERISDTSWQFTVREGVQFHNGGALSADTVVNSLQRAIDATPLPRILDGVDMTVRAEGDTVIIDTAAPDPLLPHRLSSPQLAILDAEAYSKTGVNPIGTGSGPFELVDVDGVVGATLDRFPEYWGESAEATGIDVKFVPDGTARAAALRTGTADIVEAIPAGQAAEIDASLITEVPMPRTNTLYLNTEAGPFADPAVRAAAREAIDRAAIVESVYEGRADVAEGLLGPALPWAADYRSEPELQELLAARPQAAKVDGVKISLGTFTDRAELPEVAVMLEQQLEAAGFEVQQDVREYQFIEADALEGKFDAFILSRATVLDSGDPVAYLASDFTCEGGFSIAQLCEQPVDQAIQSASEAEAGPTRQLATMRAETEVLATDAVIPLLHERVIQGESERIENAARDPRERLLVTPDTHRTAK